MMNLTEYRRSISHLVDFLPWAALVDEGIVLNRDGSFQRTAKFRGPDLDSAVPAELVGVASRLNNALRRLGSGWAVFVEAQRYPANKYPQGHFPDVASALVDVERRAQFEEEGAHYESNYFLTFLYLPPPEDTARAEGFLYEGRDRRQDADARQVQRGFVDRTDRVLGLVEGFMPELRWIDDEEAPARSRAGDTDVSRRCLGGPVSDRRPRADARAIPSADADSGRLSDRHDPRDSGRAQPACIRLSLVDTGDHARQD
jgi:type IV secretion system protein VirB4